MFRDSLRLNRLGRMKKNLADAQKRHAPDTCPCTACVLRRAIAEGSVEVTVIRGGEQPPAEDPASTKH